MSDQKKKMSKKDLTKLLTDAGVEVKPKTPVHILSKMAKKRGLLDEVPVQKEEVEPTPTPKAEPETAKPQPSEQSMMMQGFQMIAQTMKEGFTDMGKEIAKIQTQTPDEDLPRLDHQDPNKYFQGLADEPKQEREWTYVMLVTDKNGDTYPDHTSTSLKTRPTREKLVEYLETNKYKNYKIIPIN